MSFQAGTYPFHPESTTTIHHLEEVLIFLASEPTESGNLEIGPEMTHIVLLALHGFAVNERQSILSSVVAEDFFWEAPIGLIVDFLRIVMGFDEHFPKTLGFEVVDSLVS